VPESFLLFSRRLFSLLLFFSSLNSFSSDFVLLFSPPQLKVVLETLPHIHKLNVFPSFFLILSLWLSLSRKEGTFPLLYFEKYFTPIGVLISFSLANPTPHSYPRKMLLLFQPTDSYRPFLFRTFSSFFHPPHATTSSLSFLKKNIV